MSDTVCWQQLSHAAVQEALPTCAYSSRSASTGLTRSARLERELAALCSRMDAAYTDKLDGKITEAFWQRKRKPTGRRKNCGSNR